MSYRQGKRLWKRYREEGAGGLKHRSAGRRSNRAYPEKLRGQVLGLVREKYGGPVGERFGPTLAAEHLASEDGLRVEAEIRQLTDGAGCWGKGYGARQLTGSGGGTGAGGSARGTSGRWCRWTAAFTGGWRSAARKVA